MRRALVCCFALVALAPVARAADPKVSGPLQPFVENKQPAGAVVLVANPDKILTVEAVGFADRENKLAMQPEGPNSPIEALLAADPATAKPVKVANGVTTAANDAGSAGAPASGGTLAERIRALQSHASRARQQGA